MDAETNAVLGSDDVNVLPCQPCSRDGIVTDATQYCRDCVEYVCDRCRLQHAKFRTTKAHVIVERQGEITPVASDAPDGAKAEEGVKSTCSRHESEVLGLYCRDHGDVCCGVCAALDHGQCVQVVSIRDLVKTTDMPGWVKTVKRDIETLKQRLQQQIKMRTSANARLDGGKNDALEEVRKIRQDLVKILDQLETEAVRKISKVYKSEKKRIDLDVSACNEALEALDNLHWENKTPNAGHDAQLFVEAKLAEQTLKSRRQEADALLRNRIQTKISFKSDAAVNSLGVTMTTLGNVETSSENAEVCLLETIPTKLEDVELGSVSGMTCMDDGRVLIAANVANVLGPNACHLLLLDNSCRTVESKCSIASAGSYIVCAIGAHEAAVVPRQQNYLIEFYKVAGRSGISKTTRSIEHQGFKFNDLAFNGHQLLALGSKTTGIDHRTEHFVYAYNLPACIRAKKIRVKTKYGLSPSHIASYPGSDKIALASNRGTVRIYSDAGELLTSVQDSQLNNICAIALDQAGNVIVVTDNRDGILMVREQEQEVGRAVSSLIASLGNILPSYQGYQPPISMCYDRVRNTLLVGELNVLRVGGLNVLALY